VLRFRSRQPQVNPVSGTSIVGMADAETNQAPPTPRDADAVRPVTVGTLAWAVATLVLLTQLDQLRADGHLWWLAAAVTGTALGLVGIRVVRRRRTVYRAAGRDAG